MEFLSLDTLKSKAAAGENFTATDILSVIDISLNYESIKTWAVAMRICTKIEWNVADKKEKRSRRRVEPDWIGGEVAGQTEPTICRD